MDSEGAPFLAVDFIVDPQFGGIAQMQAAMSGAEAQVLKEAQNIERATSGMVNLGGATAQVRAFGPAVTRELQSVAAETNRAERAGEGMVRNLLRQAETFGKTTAEIRNMRAEQRAAAAEGQGLTDLAARIRAANAELVRLEAGQGGVAKGSSQMRAAMQGASFQVQDLITQISMGTNPVNALAVQGGQLAGQFANVEGRAGAVARFMIGPWGLAITAGTMVLAPFVAKLFDGNKALDDAVDKLKKDAKETEVASKAKEAFARTTEGLTAAIRDNEKALDALRDAGRTAAQQAADSTRATVLRIEAVRAETLAELELAKAMAETSRLRASRGSAQQQELAGASYLRDMQRVLDVENALAANDMQLAKARAAANEALGFAVAERAQQNSTAEGRINAQFDRRLRLRTQELSAAGKMNELYAETLKIERERAAALERIQKAQRTTNPLGEGVATFRSREQAIGMAGRELQGMGMRVDGNVQFGYTKGHANDADHNRYAIDVNVGKGVTEANIPDLKKRYDEIARLYQARGYEVIWNGQMYAPLGNGPTGAAKGHQNHLHLRAPQSIVGKATNASTMRQDLAELGREAREEAARAKAIMDEATGYLSRLEGESSVFGRTASEIKSMEVAAAAAKAPTEELKQAIIAAGADLDLKKSYPTPEDINNLKLAVDLTNLAKNPFEDELEGLQKIADQMNVIADQAAVMGDALASAFGRPGEVIGGLVARMADYNARRADLVATGMEEAEVDKQLSTLRIRNTAQAISGVKSLFKEHSTAYKVMGAIEKAHAALQLVNAIRAIAMDGAKTASSIANSGARAAADGVAAIAKAIASMPFPLNIAAGAATAAALVAFGVKVFGGGGGGGVSVAPPSAEDLQAGAGTGTVLGDSKAQSESIQRSLEIVASNTNRDLEYSNDMLRSLRSIDTGIARLAGTVAQQIQVSGSMFDTSGQNLGQTGSKGFLGLFGSSTTRSLYDLGLQLGSASVASILANGIGGSTYQTVEQIKKKNGFLGIGGGTKTSYITSTGAVDPAITSAITDVVRSLRDGLVGAAGVIGVDGAAAILDSFQVSIGKVSFKDMSGEEIERQLNAIFSSIGDQMAGRLLPSLSSLQLVGEGLFETFTRVAREYQVVDITLSSMGRTFGMVGLASVAARDALVQLFGGLDDFVERSEFFRDQFLTEGEQIAPVQAALVAELQRLGAAGLKTRDQFKQAVLGLDLTTAAGREMYASLLAVAPAFDKVLDYQEQAQKKTIDGLKQTVDQFGKIAESLKNYRDGLFLTEAAQGNAYGTLLARFNSTAALAKTGDQKALGELESAGKALLDASLNNASTREQYLRDVALVARGVDAGIFAAEETADYAQLQLDALGNAVTILTAIETNTAAQSAEAAAFLEAVRAAAINAAAIAPPADNSAIAAALDDLRAELAELRGDTNSGLTAIAGHTGNLSRTFDSLTAETGGLGLATVPLA